MPVGPLALGDADSASALNTAGAFLGLDLTLSQSYMLVTFERIDNSAQHPFISQRSSVDRSNYLSDAAQSIIAALTPASAPESGSVLYDSKLSLADASSYLAAIYKLGTHFVSEITVGDQLIQVFAYDSTHFKTLQAEFANDATTQPDGTLAVSGLVANAWAYYTSPLNGNYGFVANYGSIATISRDATLAAAVAAGSWPNSYDPKGPPSIFAAAANNNLLVQTASVPIALTLTPIADLISNLLIAGPWDRIAVGGLLQKYGDGLDVPLRREVDLDWSSIFPQTDDSWTSNIVTPTIDIYQERVDLAKVQLQGGDLVAANFKMQSFTAFAQVIEASTQPGAAPIALPSDDITLIAQIIDTTEAAQTPVLTMSPTAFEQFTVVCQEMYGPLIFQTTTASGTQRKIALDGFLFSTLTTLDPTTGRYVVDISGVFSDAPSAAVVSSVKQSIEFSVVAGESLLHAFGPNSETIREIEQSYLEWLAGIIPADTADPDLAYNRARALYLANHAGTFSSDAITVPYVTYETYRSYVQDLVNQAQTIQTQISNYQIQITDTINAYQEMTSIAALNANIKAIGGVLTQYFSALASGRQSMDGYYNSIIAQLTEQQQQAEANIATLTAKLQAQQAVINLTSASSPGIVQTFEQDYANYVNDQVAQAVVSGVTGLFEVGAAAFAIPEAAEGGVLKAMEAFKEVYDQLQAVMQVLQSIQAVINAAGSATSQLNTLSSQISALSANLQMPSQVDLQILSQNVQASLAGVPNDNKLNQDKANLIAAVNTLVIIGTALLEAQTTWSQTQMQISNTYRLKTINLQQQAQMDALATNLNLENVNQPPDINSIDLIGVTGQLQYQLKQVLLTLAQTLEIQNGAIQYEYMGQPATITSFTLLNLLSVISTQDLNVINGITNLNPQPQSVTQPITITIPNVKASRVSGTNVFQFPIHLSNAAFSDFDMVRIDRVVPNISGIKSTSSGNYEIHLSCQAKPFQDRDYNGNVFTFETVQRDFGPYVYNATSGDAEFGTNVGTFASKTTPLTPFSLWEISLPSNVQNNQGIQFESVVVDITLDFYITAQYHDQNQRHAALLQCFAAAGRPVPAELRAASTADTPTLAALEAQMFQNQAVLQGWDAVFNVLDGPINAFLNQQFQAYVAQLGPDPTTNIMSINAYYCQDVQKFQHTWFTNVTQLSIQLTNPLLQFIAGSDSVTVIQNILSAEIITGTMVVTQQGFSPNTCNLPGNPLNFTVNATTNTLTLSSPGYFENNMQVAVSSTGTLPAPLTAGPVSSPTAYWIVNWTNSGGQTTLQLSDTAGGAPIAFTSAGSGTFTIVPNVEWSTPMKAVITNNPYICGSVPLAQVSGLVTPPGTGSAADTRTIILDFPQGAFTLNNFSVQPSNWTPGPNAVEISNALASYFATNDIKYQIHTLNLSNVNSNVALTPTKFMLNAINTNAGNNILQVLIATTGNVQNAHTINLNEPIPYDPANPVPGSSNFMTSLMIGTELMFQDIFVGSFNNGGNGVLVQAVNPGNNYQAWSAQVTQGTATGAVTFNNPYSVSGTQVNYRVNSSNNNLQWSLVGMNFQASQASGIALSYSNGSGGTSVNFQYQEYYPPSSEGHGIIIPGHWGSWQDASAVAYITMTGNYPLTVTGSGSAQLVQFSTTKPTVQFSQGTDLTPSSGCQCNDNDIKIRLLAALGDSVPATLQANMAEITFTPISVFALESLLFPADQLLTMQQAVVPGDLLVVGSFLAQVRTPNPTYNVTISAAAGAKGVFGGTNFTNGTSVNSVTQNGLTPSISFRYGPINSALGEELTYSLNLNTGAISPALMVVVVQPDPVNHPETVILLPPGYGATAG